MSDSLPYIALSILFIAFSTTLSIIVLRFTTVLQQIKRSDSMDRSELMRELDASHVQAFSNALTALSNVHERVAADQNAMFSKTIDMVHGPVGVDGKDENEYAVDNTNLDMRAAWEGSDDDDMDDADPTDDDGWLSLTADVMPDRSPRAVSVRPGETLVPNG